MRQEWRDTVPSPASNASVGGGGPPTRVPSKIGRVAVLLATHQGHRFLREQLDTLLGQSGVDVEVLASDDASTDGTWELLQEAARSDPRVRVLPRGRRFGSAAPNFYHLIQSVDPKLYDAVALADQDDLWFEWKIEAHLELLRARDVGGVSSSVLAFWPDGREQIVEKAGALRRFDHVFQGPGPGCTFLITPLLVEVVQRCLGRADLGATRFPFHDWLFYAIARSSGLGWYIDERPSLRYRQHESNEWGANAGISAARRRLRRLVDGTYDAWVRHVLDIGRAAAAAAGVPPPPERISAIGIAMESRRRLADRLLIAATHPLGVKSHSGGGGGS